MDLRTVLTTDTVNLHLKGTTKEEIVDEMLDVLYKAGKVTDKATARECVLDREGAPSRFTDLPLLSISSCCKCAGKRLNAWLYGRIAVEG